MTKKELDSQRLSVGYNKARTIDVEDAQKILPITSLRFAEFAIQSMEATMNSVHDFDAFYDKGVSFFPGGSGLIVNRANNVMDMSLEHSLVEMLPSKPRMPTSWQERVGKNGKEGKTYLEK